MTKRVGQMLVSYELLAKMMKIDGNGYEITAMVPQTAEDLATKTIRIMVNGPSVPLMGEGCGNAPIVQWYDPYRHFDRK